jgi:hypothetical protein
MSTVSKEAPCADVAAIVALEIRAEIRAYLEYEHQFEDLADAVDPLQKFAEQSGLVAAIGQDAVQQIIAAPFARFRAILAAEIEAEERADQFAHDDSTSVDEIVRRLELADPRDRWKYTGEPPPPEEIRNSDISGKPASMPRPRATAQSTVDAFKFVVSLGDPERLATWLRNHPGDVPALLSEVA